MSETLIENRIGRWRSEEGGKETEMVVELLCDAEEQLRRLRSENATLYDTVTRCQNASNRDLEQRRDVMRRLTAYIDRYKPVNDELERARSKHPGPRHLMIALMEEVGEAAEAILRFGQKDHRTVKELRQVACVAFRLLEENDRTLPSGADLEGTK